MDERLEISYLHYVTEIQSRYATTEISGEISNKSKNAKEMVFTVFLPGSAFVTYMET